ncbi:MAG: LarC family nickel insertion protein, partial [Oscillospiraceae bacterium]|nr:LarC family nickel insertion protein [Oscillospiraceae bacterium]
GYGMGKKDFPIANCLRAILGEGTTQEDEILELSCNLDDMTPEDVGFAMELLLKKGALDVYTVPIGMKKSRPGVLLSVLCKPAQKETMVSILFAHTNTLGIRENPMHRYTLEREIRTVETEFGPVRCKISTGYGTEKQKYEADDLARIVRETGLPLSEIRSRLP